ncbi:GDP-mannose 4,6-dehydratase [soil metagenome]
MKTVAVTGANGFVGRHVVHELLQNGYEVLAVNGSVTPQIEEQQSGVKYVSVDLSKQEELNKVDLSNVEAIIHLAGLAAVGPSFDDPMRYITTNSSLEANLLQRAVEQGVTPRFIVISSGSLYDPQAPLPINEQSTVIPSSPYAVSKITQEQLGHYYGNRGFEVIVARPFNHIGPGQGLGFLVSDLASQIVACEQGSSDPIMVGNLDAKRDYTDVRDIARAYRLLLEEGRPGETYNICSGVSLSGHQILDALLKYSNARPTIKQDQARMRPSDAPDIYGSHDKIARDTGWQPNIELSQTISDVLAFWRAEQS